MTVTSVPVSSSTLRSSASAYFRPSWKMCPISMPRASSSGPEPSGQDLGSDLGGLHGAVGGEVSTRHQVEDMPTRCVRSGDPPRPLDHPGVEQVSDLRRGLGAQVLARLAGLERGRPDVAANEGRVAGEVGVGERLDLGGYHRRLEPPEVDFAVAGYADDQRRPCPVRLPQGHHDVLQRVAGIPAPIRPGESVVRERDKSLDRRCVRGVLDVGLPARPPMRPGPARE